MLTDELLAYVFDGQSHFLVQPMGTWLASSRRFVAFVTAFRDKIRKKLRVTQDGESFLDLRLELETAYLLLREYTLSLAYEPQQAERVRSPDFAVTYTTSLTFMIEVTRIRAEAQEQTSAQNPTPFKGERLADAICSKLGQLSSQRSNVLLIGVESLGLTQDDLRSVILRIQQRAERNDPLLFQRYSFRDRADFFRCYQRLSEVLVRGAYLKADEPIVTWVNPQAKYPLPGKVRTILYRSHVA